MELYAADLEYYTAASSAHYQKIEAPRNKFEMGFQSGENTTKYLERRGVAWSHNEIWYNICVVECVLSKDPGSLFGYERFGFH